MAERMRREAPAIEAYRKAEEAKMNRPAGEIIAERFRKAEEERAAGKRHKNASGSSLREGLQDERRLSARERDDLYHNENGVGDPLDLRNPKLPEPPKPAAELPPPPEAPANKERDDQFSRAQMPPVDNVMQSAAMVDSTPNYDQFPRAPRGDFEATSTRGSIGGTPLPADERERGMKVPGSSAQQQVTLAANLNMAPIRVEHTSGKTGEVIGTEYYPVTKVDSARGLGTMA
jgi:hypothetical protein